VVGAIACVLAMIGSFAWNREKAEAVVEENRYQMQRAAGGEDYFQIGRLINKLVSSNDRNQSLVALRSAEQDFIKQEIGSLMKEFGAEEYLAPEEFVRSVSRFVRQYQGPDHNLMARVLQKERPRMDQVRQILRRESLPEDLCYMALVESSFLQSPVSQEGAAGFWQFTPSTAREYGIRVDNEVDERLDLVKSTEAASRYIRELILDFGSGSSVMLAMAAYNSGPETVRRAVRNVKNPIKQRNFWYLYNAQALPNETREYVTKVCAAILIGRNAEHFGF
jgi:membrane-bound lytic murein transglycosylase D